MSSILNGSKSPCELFSFILFHPNFDDFLNTENFASSSIYTVYVRTVVYLPMFLCHRLISKLHIFHKFAAK